MIRTQKYIVGESIIGGKKCVEKDDVTIIVPTLNEENAIELVIQGLISENYKNILVVDGNSQDNTLEIVKKMGVQVAIQKGKGKTGAVVTAISLVKTPYLLLIDGDYTYDPGDIVKLLEKAPDYCQVIGARINKNKIPLFNRFGNTIINVLFNLFFGSKLSDVCSGLYVIRTSFAKELVLESQGFDVEVEIAAYSAMDSVVAEVPISYRDRIGRKKLNPIKDGFKIVSTITKLAKKHRSSLYYTVLVASIMVPTGISYILINRLQYGF